MSAARSQIASSFGIIKGALIEETYAIFQAWDFSLTKKANLDRVRDDNRIAATSLTWLRDVTKVVNRRFEVESRDRPLIMLAQRGLPLDEWRPLLLWHVTRDEFLLRDFLSNWLYPAYEAGAYRLSTNDVKGYVAEIGARGGVTEHPWTEQTAARVAAGLLKIAVDFELLQGSIAKEFASYQLPERSFLYLLHAMHDQAVNPSKLVTSHEWRLFLMRPSDVEQELLRLHQFRRLQYEAAGSLVQLTLPCASTEQFAERMVA